MMYNYHGFIQQVQNQQQPLALVFSYCGKLKIFYSTEAFRTLWLSEGNTEPLSALSYTLVDLKNAAGQRSLRWTQLAHNIFAMSDAPLEWHYDGDVDISEQGGWCYNLFIPNGFLLHDKSTRLNAMYTHLEKFDDDSYNQFIGEWAMSKTGIQLPGVLGEHWFSFNEIPVPMRLIEFPTDDSTTRAGFYETVEASDTPELTNPMALDPLTRLPNVYYYLSVARASRQIRHKLRMTVLIEIDQLKRIQSALGVRYLTLLFKTLSGLIREKHAQLSQLFLYNHNTLGLLLIIDEQSVGLQLVDYLHELFETPWYYDEFVFFSKAAIGYTFWSSDQVNPLSALREADMALTYAIHQQSVRCQGYVENMRQVVLDNVKLFGDIRLAMDNKELTLLYQPQVSIQTGKIIGAEALVRWQHPEKGLLPPSTFLCAIEAIGSTYLLDEYVAQSAAADLKQLQIHGFDDMTISINISATSLNITTFNQDLFTIVSMAGVTSNRLTLEITESAMIFTDAFVQKRLNRLKHHGFRLSLDDFGTGYSSMNYLGKLPLDEMKIDKVFVDELLESDVSRFLFEKMIEMAKRFNLQVIIEGVESIEQLNLIRELAGSEATIQGYYFYRPVPFQQLLKLLEDDLQLAEEESQS